MGRPFPVSTFRENTNCKKKSFPMSNSERAIRRRDRARELAGNSVRAMSAQTDSFKEN